MKMFLTKTGLVTMMIFVASVTRVHSTAERKNSSNARFKLILEEHKKKLLGSDYKAPNEGSGTATFKDCEKCNDIVPSKKVFTHYDTNGKEMVVCLTCYGKLEKVKKEYNEKNKQKRQADKEKRIQEEEEYMQKIRMEQLEKQRKKKRKRKKKKKRMEQQLQREEDVRKKVRDRKKEKDKAQQKRFELDKAEALAKKKAHAAQAAKKLIKEEREWELSERNRSNAVIIPLWLSKGYGYHSCGGIPNQPCPKHAEGMFSKRNVVPTEYLCKSCLQAFLIDGIQRSKTTGLMSGGEKTVEQEDAEKAIQELNEQRGLEKMFESPREEWEYYFHNLVDYKKKNGGTEWEVVPSWYQIQKQNKKPDLPDDIFVDRRRRLASLRRLAEEIKRA